MAIAELLLSNTSLKRLLLDGNRIQDDGAIELAYALQETKTLTYFDIRGIAATYTANVHLTLSWSSTLCRQLDWRRWADGHCGRHRGSPEVEDAGHSDILLRSRRSEAGGRV
jgi:hypothetical protein